MSSFQIPDTTEDSPGGGGGGVPGPGSVGTTELADSSVTTAKIQNNTILLEDINSGVVGSANGLAELDENGRVPASQLPSYVDDVIVVDDFASLPVTGEAGKIYITADDNLTFRWSGSAYTEISQSLALGENSSTAYRGDRGKVAYDHSQVASGNPHGTVAGDVGFTPAGGISSTNVQAALAELDGDISGMPFSYTADGYTTANINLSSAPASVTSGTPDVDDVIVCCAQSTAVDNGPWVYKGSGNAMVRPSWWSNGSVHKNLVPFLCGSKDNSGGAAIIIVYANPTTTNITVGTTSVSGRKHIGFSSTSTQHEQTTQFSGNVTILGNLTSNRPVTHGADDVSSLTKELTFTSRYVQRAATASNTVSFTAGSSSALRSYLIVDASGNASNNNISFTATAGTVNGSASPYVINTNYGGALFIAYNNTDWVAIPIG